MWLLIEVRTPATDFYLLAPRAINGATFIMAPFYNGATFIMVPLFGTTCWHHVPLMVGFYFFVQPSATTQHHEHGIAWLSQTKYSLASFLQRYEDTGGYQG